MAKHICGTCRFYEEAGLAGSGWCHHPQRNVITGAIVLVRRNELACRDDWQHSLWESAAEPRTLEAPVTERAMPIGPVPPASPRTIRAVVSSDETELHEGEDVLLSEARIVSETHERRHAAARPAPASGFDSRSAIFRARESFRDRARVKSSVARQATGAFAEPGSDLRENLREPGPAAAPQPAETGFTPAHPVSQSVARRDLEAAVSASAVVSAPADPVDPNVAAHMPTAGIPEQGRYAPISVATEPNPQPNLEPAQDAFVDRTETGSDQSAPPFSRQGEGRAARTDLPVWFRTDLPRVCRSCRDYRPAADGQRGWCANSWAFTHSRLVQADQIAPCQSAIGDWWVPADDVWLVAADVSAHGRPTPMLDRTDAATAAKRRRS